MINYRTDNIQLRYLRILFLLLSMAICTTLHAQRAQDIVDRYFEAIGGKEAWQNLKSRIDNETLEYYRLESLAEMIDHTTTKTNFFLAPNNYLWKESEFFYRTIMASTSRCKWLYSDKGPFLMFFGADRIDKETTYPRIGALEVLNFKMIDSVYIEGSSYRIDFEDEVRDDGIQSLYFYMENSFVHKQSFLSKGTRWEFHYKDYREKKGYWEPYRIVLFGGGSRFFELMVDNINYNQKIEPSMFEPPQKCNKKKFETLAEPILFDF